MKNQRINMKIIATFGGVLVLCLIFVILIMIFNLSAVDSLRSAAELSQNSGINQTIDALESQLLLIYIFGGCLITASLILAFALSKNISKPLEFLAEAISGIAETGNIYLDDAAYKESKVLNARGDEIGKISRSVGDMLAMFRNKIQSLNAISKGDLTTNVVCRSSKDSIGTALAAMVESLNGMFNDIRSASNQVSARSLHLDDGAQALALGSGEQAESIERLSTTISTVAEQTSQNAQMATEAAGLSESIKQLAEKSGRQMIDMTDAVNKINQSSDEISKVIRIIDDIAFQTNILALNASVEAARAGQQGKGFAVVAQEIRTLAAKSQVAANDTGAMITDSIEKARLGSKIAEETAASLNEIVQNVNESARLTDEIARSSGEQAQAIAQINTGIEQVNLVVQRNSQTASESADASKEVSTQSEILQKLIGQFKTK